MDLPPSGWYPDPYGTPQLLRWWDGSVWTQHTHPDVTAGAGGGEPAATAVQAATAASTAVQAAAGPGGGVQAAGLQATAVQTASQAGGLQATTVQPAARQPSAEWLRRTKPPTGQPTAPQPALPTDPVAAAAVAAAAGIAPTAYQPAVTTVQPATGQPGGVQATGVQATAVQAGGMQTMTMQPTAAQPGPGGAGAGTQVLFAGGEPWQAPAGPPGPGGPGGWGGPSQGNPYGYQEAQRRRRRRLIGGIAAGTVVAAAAIAIIVASLSGSPSAPAADQSPTAPPASPTALSSPTTAASPTASASPTTTASQSLLTDAQSGLSYTQLPAPWQATASCPSTLSAVQAFPWTDGEYAEAGAVNGNSGPTTWYGEACSGPLPLQYGYSGVADLQGTAENLATTFQNAYYSPLNHTVTQGSNNPVQVSGHAAWEVTYDVTYTTASAQGATWTDEEAAVVVVDTGTDEPAVFFTSVPDTLNEGNITTLVSSLQLAAAPSGASTQPAGGTPSDGANP